ncbi:MAG TPA: hypothetical protein DD979_01540 [Gammaproteobacteria bacterium]|jgi:hypothetical protein|nr:hypothetical protein [Gammaproteobacteria bacterium]
MQNTPERPQLLHVPTWLIVLELCVGTALLYISSSTLINTDMHLARDTEDREPHAQLATPAGTDVLNSQELLVSAGTPTQTHLTQ